MVEIVPVEWRAPLLAFSRELLASQLDGKRRSATTSVPPLPAVEEAPFLAEHYGIFVTLRKRGDLRGCIGRITSDRPLAQSLPQVTVEAALQDWRFPALTIEELPVVTIEHSILTKPEPVERAQAIVLGRHGIILSIHRHRALFLPEVATEQRWDLQETLGHLSRKAGLDQQAWRSPEARFEVFETQHYGEGDER